MLQSWQRWQLRPCQMSNRSGGPVSAIAEWPVLAVRRFGFLGGHLITIFCKLKFLHPRASVAYTASVC